LAALIAADIECDFPRLRIDPGIFDGGLVANGVGAGGREALDYVNLVDIRQIQHKPGDGSFSREPLDAGFFSGSLRPERRYFCSAAWLPVMERGGGSKDLLAARGCHAV
jgi:hypothetical protein